MASAAISSSRIACSTRPNAELVRRQQMAQVSTANAAARNTYLNGWSMTQPNRFGRGIPGNPAWPLVRSVQFMNTASTTTCKPNEATT